MVKDVPRLLLEPLLVFRFGGQLKGVEQSHKPFGFDPPGHAFAGRGTCGRTFVEDAAALALETVTQCVIHQVT